MSDADQTRIIFNIDEDTKELVQNKLEHGELSKLLRQEVEEIAFGEEVSKRSKLEKRLDGLRDRRDELQSEQDRIAAELKEVESKIDRIESRLDELESREDNYEVALEMLEDQLADGAHIFPQHGQVQKAAHIAEIEPEDVITDLKDRNPSVPEYAFMDRLSAPQEWTGTHDQAVAVENGRGVDR